MKDFRLIQENHAIKQALRKTIKVKQVKNVSIFITLNSFIFLEF